MLQFKYNLILMMDSIIFVCFFLCWIQLLTYRHSKRILLWDRNSILFYSSIANQQWKAKDKLFYFIISSNRNLSMKLTRRVIRLSKAVIIYLKPRGSVLTGAQIFSVQKLTPSICWGLKELTGTVTQNGTPVSV